MNSAKSKLVALVLPLCFLMFVFATTAFGALTGHIYTTDFACGGVDLNIYDSQEAVYLNGGPAHVGGSSLPDGSYYVRVTDPSGSLLLGTSIGSGNDTPFVVSGGVPQSCYQLTAILIKASDSTAGYDLTNNPGGEYKVWVGSDLSFTNAKTDNFKVRSGPGDTATLCVSKFYDANANGLDDDGQPIAGWQFTVYADDNLIIEAETAHCAVVDPGTYHVFEATPVETSWVHTTVNPVDVNLTANQTTYVSFGNLCLGPGGGLTIGFWSNKNGQSLENADDFAALTALNLVGATGAPQNFATGSTNAILTANRTALNTWLLNATATNMSYMLSAQLAAMKLNVINGKVSVTALVRTGGCGNTGVNNQYITIADLMAAADAALMANPVCLSGNPARANEECLKNALDDANNNKNFVQATPCGFTFAP